MEGYHKSVLLREATEALKVTKGEWYLDCTLGDGGYSLEILKQGGKVVGVDVDPEALERARKRLGKLGFLGNIVLIQGNFRDIKDLIKQTELRDQITADGFKFAGAVFDLGVSSLQLETPLRGFSFGKEGPLDMRMDPTLGVTALDLINTLSRKEFYELFQTLGEEKYSKRLADTLVRSRKVGVGIKTTKDLAEMVERVYRRMGIRDLRLHPATKVFKALRIVVNDELGALKEGLREIADLIKKDGRIVVISFHSLEDRVAKNTFREWKLAGMGEILTKKPLVPSEEEVIGNPRARSAKMRVFKI